MPRVSAVLEHLADTALLRVKRSCDDPDPPPEFHEMKFSDGASAPARALWDR
jgi:hypothetical protein